MRDHAADKLEQQAAFLVEVPVDPGQLVVLAVGVVVAALRAADLVARHQHRHALRQQQRGDEIALLAGAQRAHLRIVGGSFHAAVPRQVVVVAVAVVLQVGLVVLAVVADQVLQREAVVAGDEVDAGVRLAPAGLVQVARAGEAAGELADHAAVALPVGAHGVAVAVVPLGPAERELAHLVAALAQVPGLGDQLDLREHRVLADGVEEGAQPVHLVQLARQRGGEVEAKPVHVHVQHPVAQAVHDQLQHARLAHVERVAAARVVLVVARILGRQPVVGRVVDAAQAQASGPMWLPSAVWL